MVPTAALRSVIKAERKRGALWVQVFDLARLIVTAEGRSVLWTRLAYGNDVHQTTPYTREERYPALFDLAASLAPGARRILSFGCSTGEELVALRRRFPDAEIVGAEINPRSRKIAVRRVSNDAQTSVVHPHSIEGEFDLAFALAVLQREPHKIAEMSVQDLSDHYRFQRFDAAVRELCDALRPGGLLCVANAHYRIEDSSVGAQLDAIAESSPLAEPLFGADGRRLQGVIGHTLFRKRSSSMATEEAPVRPDSPVCVQSLGSG